VTGAFDLAIAGSGFGGSLLAMVARRLGLSVLLLERGAHPRFAIGESTSPLTNLLLEELAQRYDLPRLLPLASYGTWKRTYPDLVVGLKRGFTFYGHRAGEPYRDDPERSAQLLVAASPENEVADTHWYRAAFDEFLLREAQSLAVEYVDRVSISDLARCGNVTSLAGERNGRSVRYRARFVVDATGPRGLLSRLLELPEIPWDCLPPTQGLYTHFANVGRMAELAESEGAPYPPDDAALHHLFDGGWIWVLRFENGITSSGVAAEDWFADELRLEEGEPAWQRLLERFPTVRRQFAAAAPVLPFITHRRLPYRCAEVVGDGWALLPSATAFIDPLFSTGFPLTLLGIHRLGRALAEAWDTPAWEERLRQHAQSTRDEAEASAWLVGGCYAAFRDFPTFAALSMLYFTAASYAEMARRLDRPHLASQFLLRNQPSFRRALEGHTAATRTGRPPAPPAVYTDVEPFNIAGLCDPAKRNWYPVDLEDVVRGAAKLERSPEEVRQFFERMGWR